MVSTFAVFFLGLRTNRASPESFIKQPVAELESCPDVTRHSCEYTRAVHEQDLLIVVDVQNGFVNANSEHVVKPIFNFAQRWIDGGGEVIATKFINQVGGPWETLIHWTRLQGSPETDLHPTVRPLFESSERCHVIEKTTYSSINDEVLKFLSGRVIRNIYICGIATDGCVLKTAVDVFEKRITPIVLTDLCASHAGQEIHEAGLLLTGRFIGRDQLVHSQTVFQTES